MSDGDPSQPRILLLAVEFNLAFQNASGCRSAQCLVCLVDRGQQLDVGPREALRETPSSINRRLDTACGAVASDQPRHLRPAQPGHLLDVASYQAPRRLALLGVFLPDKHSLQPTVNLLPVLAFKPDCLAGLDEPAHRFQAQLLCFVHADVQSPACLTLQAHLVLESNPPFRLILYWKRVTDADWHTLA